MPYTTTQTVEVASGGVDCCCEPIYVDCCPEGIAIPDTLYGTLVNATGDCAGYSPTSWTFVYDPVNSDPLLGHLWNASGPGLGNNESPSTSGGITDYTLGCQFTGGVWNWYLNGYAVLLDCQNGFATSDCDPLMLTIDFIGSGDVSCNGDDFGGLLCSGTYQVVITE